MKISFASLLCLISLFVKAQSGFTRNISIPVFNGSQLQLPWAGGLNFPVFSEIDLNNDNVPDLFAFDRSNNRVLTFINNGGPGTSCWEYAPQYADKFPSMQGWAFLYDYNCDNRPDIFTVNFRNNGISIYRNDSYNGNVVFTLVDSTINYNYTGTLLSNIIASVYLEPDFDDVDGDGDMDIIGQQFQCVGGFAYYKNMSMEHLGTCDSLNDFVLVTNSWGKFTLRPGTDTNVVVQYWNVNCFQANDSIPSYEIARRDDTYANIKTIDIDGDGDKDALIGDSGAYNSLLVVNGGNNTNATMVSEDTLFPVYDQSVHLHSFVAHAFVDADNDGVKDLIVSQSEWENKHGNYFYKNNGSNIVPHFNHVENDFLQNQMIDVGESATPVLFDYDGDGLKDLIIGNRYTTVATISTITGLTLYKNSGTLTSPSFEFVTDDYAGLQSLNLVGQIFPAFGDLDNDGDMDMILGSDDGSLMYFENTAGAGNPASFAAPVYFYMSIDVGQASTPQLYDLNQDGMLDLLIGDKNGRIKYFENSGSPANPFFSSVANTDTLGGIDLRPAPYPDGYSVPFAFSQNGNTRMLVSGMYGDIILYGNIDGNLTGNFTILDTVLTKTAGSRYGYNLSVSGGDLNNDSLVDMVIGIYGGGPQIYYQDNLSASISSPSRSGELYRVLPNPVSESLVVKSFRTEDNAVCSLFDITGRLIMTRALSGGYAVIDVSAIDPGSYFLRISSEKISVTKKITVER